MSNKPKFCQKRKERLKLLIHLTIDTLKVIKPLCGTDSLLLQNLETYFTLQYPKVGQSSSKTSCTLKIKNCHVNTFAYKGWFIGNSRHNKHIHISTVCTAEQEIVTICIKSYVSYFVGQKSSFSSNTCGKGTLKPVLVNFLSWKQAIDRSFSMNCYSAYKTWRTVSAMHMWR